MGLRKFDADGFGWWEANATRVIIMLDTKPHAAAEDNPNATENYGQPWGHLRSAQQYSPSDLSYEKAGSPKLGLLTRFSLFSSLKNRY